MQKTFALLFCAAAILVCSGCAGVNRGSQSGYAGGPSEAPLSGSTHGSVSSSIVDYEQILADPGPF
jgi:hypothetical protein